jgi:hypothetical protein
MFETHFNALRKVRFGKAFGLSERLTQVSR